MTMIRLICNLTIHLAQAVLDTLDQRKPMMDDPLPGGVAALDGPPYAGPFEDCGLFWSADNQNGDSDSAPRNDVPNDERASDDHPVTPGGFRW